MRKTLTALLLAAIVVLPGCIFAVGAEDWDDDDGFHSSRMSKLENRVAELEEQVEDLSGR